MVVEHEEVVLAGEWHALLQLHLVRHRAENCNSSTLIHWLASRGALSEGQGPSLLK